MVNGSANTVLRQVARVFDDGTLTGLSDRQMLERFVELGDEAGFEVLVARHGPMVYHVCRQLLRDPNDTEDAFQAVFLVLVRKAGVIRLEGSLGPWLYKVAHRVAARARATRRRWRTREISVVAEFAASPPDDSVDRLDADGVIQQELGRLPERLRAPLVLCYLQGMTHELAAGQLGCPVGTVRSRLSRGRAKLLTQIIRRGLTLSAAGLLSSLQSNAGAASVPAIVRIKLIKLATFWIAEKSAVVGGCGASASVAVLLEGVLNAMRIKNLAIMGTALVALGALGLVIAERAAAVGGSPVQESAPGAQAPGAQAPMVRRVGPDGRRIGSRQAARRSDTIIVTYYVGEILGVTTSSPVFADDGSLRGFSEADLRHIVDMHPLVELITSTVAPEIWQTDDDERPDVRDWCFIRPHYFNLSLIVRCDEATHKQVNHLLQGMREIFKASSKMSRAAPVQQPASLPSQIPKRERVQKILDLLQQEIQLLPGEQESTPTVVSPKNP
jgi:RNA polymerase sigma factor (sigma-70 family)